MINSEGYSFSSDYWSFGVVMFEMLTGTMPFGAQAQDIDEVFDCILEEEITFPPDFTDSNSKNLIKQLLNKDPEKRIGSSLSTLKNHPMFVGTNWLEFL